MLSQQIRSIIITVLLFAMAGAVLAAVARADEVGADRETPWVDVGCRGTRFFAGRP